MKRVRATLRARPFRGRALLAAVEGEEGGADLGELGEGVKELVEMGGVTPVPSPVLRTGLEGVEVANGCACARAWASSGHGDLLWGW